MTIYILDKKIGETPLEAIQKIKKKDKSPITYAGRLDPAAQGVLIALSEKDIIKKEKFIKLPKEYEVQIIFGLETDTGDLLGIPKFKKINFVEKKDLEQTIKKMTGKRKQKYHPYSSKTILGKPLWKITRENKKIKIPEHKIEIKSIKIIKQKYINFERVLMRVKKICKLVKGDFRQDEILKTWQKEKKFDKFQIFDLRINCSFGTYMRVLSNEIGKELKKPCACFCIKRTKIGKFKIKNT